MPREGDAVPSANAGVRCLLAMAACCALAGCEPDRTPTRSPLTVFAASSLTEAFSDLEPGFEADNRDVDVSLMFAGSQTLRLQIEQGAAADVYASADERHMRALLHAGLIRQSHVFAHNELVVIVPADNPAGIQSLSDLSRATRIVLGSQSVPAGSYARELLRNASSRFGAGFGDEVLRRVVSQESNVRLVRAKVELGEADAALVYRTDAMGAERIRIVPIPAGLNVQADYHIGALAGSARREIGARFVDYLRSEAARAVLERRGFSAEP
jgi:molybdate transport system substrate-binding protein